MTQRFTCSTRIEAPIESVFDLARSIDAHIGSMARFDERAVAGVTQGQVELGDDVTWRARHFGVSWTLTNRIVELARPTFLVDEQVTGPFACFRHEHRFEPDGDATTMVDDVTFRAPFGPLGRPIGWALHPYVRGLIERRNAFLKRAAEASHGSR